MIHAVVCTDIEKWFGAGDTRIQVLRGLSLEIPLGEMAMIEGPSGCGKTTLISIMAGLLDAKRRRPGGAWHRFHIDVGKGTCRISQG